MNLEQVIAQAEYSAQHCSKERIKFYEEVVLLATELKELRSNRQRGKE